MMKYILQKTHFLSIFCPCLCSWYWCHVRAIRWPKASSSDKPPQLQRAGRSPPASGSEVLSLILIRIVVGHMPISELVSVSVPAWWGGWGYLKKKKKKRTRFCSWRAVVQHLTHPNHKLGPQREADWGSALSSTAQVTRLC